MSGPLAQVVKDHTTTYYNTVEFSYQIFIVWWLDFPKDIWFDYFSGL